MFQPNLFFTKQMNSNYLKKIESIFAVLPHVNKHHPIGRPPHPSSAILNALIFKNLRGISNLAELTREIKLYPALSQACGFNFFPPKERDCICQKFVCPIKTSKKLASALGTTLTSLIIVLVV